MEEARDFIESLPRPVANKIYYNIRRVVDGDTRKGMLVVVTHGIVQKVQKTPHKEIAKAETIMKSYFNER
mgnify:CR=1 FL=1